MGMFRRAVGLVTVVMVSTAIISAPARAQDGEGLSEAELELLDYVAEAIAALDALESYTLTGANTIEQDIAAGSGTFAVTMEMDMTQALAGQVHGGKDVVPKDSTFMIEQAVSVSLAGRSNRVTMTVEMTQVEGVLYVHIRDVTGAPAVTYPEGWVNTAENPEALSNDLVNFAAFEDLIVGNVLTFTLDEETVMGIEQLEGEEIEGREMKVFALQIFPQAALENNAVAMGNLMNTSALGMEPEELFALMADGMEVDYTIWVDAETNVFYKLLSTYSMTFTLNNAATQFQDMDIATTGSGETVVSDINAPVEIVAPDVD